MKKKTITLLAYGLPALLVAGVLAFNIYRPILVLPRIGIGPGFGVSDISENKITNETMRGKIVLYSFTYTNCTSACPQLMEKLQAVRERLNNGEIELEGADIQIVTFSIDPERDTPEVLADYAARYGVTPGNDDNAVPWHFVTSDDPELVKIMVSSGFDLYYEKIEDDQSPDGYRYKFVPMIVLIDGWGIIRSEYRQYEANERLSFSDGHSDIDSDILVRDLDLMAKEARNNKGLASAAYEAAHLFSCYPP
ncbi:MAG: SCO family protein [Anaerolineae bacterium]